MNYYLDTEFLEGTQTKRFLGIPYGKTPPTIDLISIGIVDEDGREYYAISKDFNLKEAWDRFDIIEKGNIHGMEWKQYWIRENVLKPIFDYLLFKSAFDADYPYHKVDTNFTYDNLKQLIKFHGKTNEQIAEEIKEFVHQGFFPKEAYNDKEYAFTKMAKITPKFYAYFADYDWVGFCWLFGKMIDLPKGFPMYCIDLKQIMDEKIKSQTVPHSNIKTIHTIEAWKTYLLEERIDWIKRFDTNYPKKTNEHNAIADARWNKQLHEFLKSL